MELEFRESFTKDLKERDIMTLKRLKNLIEKLEASDSLDHIPNVKKLKDADNYYRIRIGDYRLGLKQENNTVVVLRFLHRKEIYRYFP